VASPTVGSIVSGMLAFCLEANLPKCGPAHSSEGGRPSVYCAPKLASMPPGAGNKAHLLRGPQLSMSGRHGRLTARSLRIH
jgi:hypothetical protein